MKAMIACFATRGTLFFAAAFSFPSCLAFTNSPFSRRSSHVAYRYDDESWTRRDTKVFGFLFNSNEKDDDHEERRHVSETSESIYAGEISGAKFSNDFYFGLEALHLSEQEHSDERKQRVETETLTRSRFVYGNELLQLRSKISNLKDSIKHARQLGDRLKVDNMKEELRMACLKDAEFVYGQTKEFLKEAETDGRIGDATKLRDEAAAVKKCLPQFNMEGLWVGKYGSHGYEMINVTYVDNTLIAYKVTGDKNVPKGEITFMADLSPSHHEGADHALETIRLTDSASKQWGTSELFRFPGKGQVAAEGYKNAKWMEGQLIMVGEEYFSFAWIPIGHQIFFGRPSADLTLKMLRDSEEKAAKVPSVDDDVQTLRAYAARCLEKTELCYVEDEDSNESHFQ